MKVHDVEVEQKVWGKNIASLKGNTTQRIPNIVFRDQVKVPVVLIKFQKEVFLTCDIFFVNKIPFFLMLSQKIYFTVVNHLENCIVPEIFKAFLLLFLFFLNGICVLKACTY